MAKEPKKLNDLFHDTLKDIYYAEKKILASLPKMAKAAQNPELKAAFEKHHNETEEQVARLEQVFATIDEKPQGKKCDAIEGISTRARKSWTNTRALPPSTPALFPRLKRSSITKSIATARWRRGLMNSATAKVQSF